LFNSAVVLLTAVRAGFGIDALVGQAQAFHGPAAHQMLLHNLRGIRGLHMAVPDGLGINHHRRPVLALVKAKRFVDAHFGAQAGGFRQLLQLSVKIAFSIGSAGRAWRIGGAGVMADKNMMFEYGQAVFLLSTAD
jgi:hypothetical protein